MVCCAGLFCGCEGDEPNARLEVLTIHLRTPINLLSLRQQRASEASMTFLWVFRAKVPMTRERATSSSSACFLGVPGREAGGVGGGVSPGRGCSADISCMICEFLPLDPVHLTNSLFQSSDLLLRAFLLLAKLLLHPNGELIHLLRERRQALRKGIRKGLEIMHGR